MGVNFELKKSLFNKTSTLTTITYHIHTINRVTTKLGILEKSGI